MSLIGEPFKDYLKKQISDRQIIHGKGVRNKRTPQELAYLNSRTSWVKLASSTSIDQSRLDLIPELKGSGQTGTLLAQQYVLFNGTSGLLTNEQVGVDFVNTPGAGNPTIRAQRADAPPGTMIDIPNPNYKPPGVKAVPNNSFSAKYISPKAGILGNSPNPAYGTTGNTDFGLVPMPGIEEATVRTLEMGSIKRASIVIKAHNRLQFDIIDMLYLRLGFTVMLEWGDSHYIENDTREIQKMGNTYIENNWFREETGTNNTFEVLQNIEKLREKYSASYDGLFGRVVNFKWTFNPDGSYTINLDVLSMGDVIESLKMNTPAYYNYYKTTVPPEDREFLPDDLLKTALGNLFYPIFQYHSKKDDDDDQNIIIGDPITIQSKNFNESENLGNVIPYKVIDEKLELLPKYSDIGNTTEDEPGTIIWNKPINPNSSNPNPNTPPPIDYIRMSTMPINSSYYIRFGALLDVIEKVILPYINQDKNNPIIKIYNRVADNLMYYVPNMISIDPRVCIINNNSFKQTDLEGTSISDVVSIFSEIEEFVHEEGDNRYGRIMNIYINISYIVDTELGFKIDKKGNVGLMDFFRNLCDSINRALGGVNNIIPKMRESDNTIYFYDQSALPEKEKLPNYIFKNSPLPKETGRFNLYGYSIGGIGKTPKNSSNFIHNIGIETSITPEYAFLISIGATAAGQIVNEDATAFSKWNTGIKDRFRTDIVTGQNQTQFGSITPRELDLEQQRLYETNQNYFRIIGKRSGGEKLYYLGLTKDTPSPGFFSSVGPYLQGVGLAAEALGRLGLGGYGQNQLFRGGGLLLQMLGRKAVGNQNQDPQGQPYFINDDIIEQNLKQMTAYYKSIQNETYKKTKKASGEVGFMPFKLQLDMDGISGMKIYNKIDIDSRFLPSNYPETLEFIVTNVTHTLKNNQWVTSIDSIASVANIFTTKELEDSSALPENFQPISIIPGFGQGALALTNVNNLAKSKSTKGPNAERLRATLRELGYREKGVELDNGGDITANTEKMASAIFRKIKELYPSIKVTVTGGNDYFHTQLTYTSRHTRGRGIDFVISPATEQNLDNVVDILKGFTKGGNGNIRYIDEYRKATKAASAPHFHISYGQGTEASSELKNAQQSDLVAYTVPNDEPNQINGEKREKEYRTKQQRIRNINKEILELGDTKQFDPTMGSTSGNYNDINPELQAAENYLKALKDSRAQFGPTINLFKNQL